MSFVLVSFSRFYFNMFLSIYTPLTMSDPKMTAFSRNEQNEIVTVFVRVPYHAQDDIGRQRKRAKTSARKTVMEIASVRIPEKSSANCVA